MKTFYGLRLALDEMQKTLDRQLASMDSIKNLTRSYFSAASLIVGLLSALQLFGVSVRPGFEGWYLAGMVTLFVLYAVFFVVILLALWPVSMTLPVDPDWDLLAENFDGKTEDAAVDKLLSSVLNAINLNKPIVARYKKLSQAVTVLFGIIILVILLLAMIPRG